jgi:DNA-binding MurR/RpiR family transcriptional regulator
MDFKALVIGRYPDLPKHQKKVADFFLDHPHDFAMLSILELAKRVGVSEATIFRFAQSMGFRSFSHFKNAVMEETQKVVQPREPFKLLRDEELPENPLTIVARQDIQNINATIHKITDDGFSRAIDLIVGANRVYTCGLGISAISCRVLAYLLNQMAIPASVLIHDSATFLEQITLMKPEDLLIAFSLPPYSRETVDAARLAKERNIPVLGICDRETAPLSLYSSVVLPVVTKNVLFTNSITALVVVINAIATEVARRNKIEISKYQEELLSILEASNYLERI